MAGLAGTVVMTVFSYFSNYLHLPSTDYHGMIASHFSMGSAFAWVIYFGLGVMLAYFYGTFFRKRLPAHSWMRGIVYAVLIWGVTEIILMPILGMGFFSGSITAAFAAFIGMALYGGTVGYLYEA